MEHFHPVTFSASSGNVVRTFNLFFFKKTCMFIVKYIHLFTTFKYKKIQVVTCTTVQIRSVKLYGTLSEPLYRYYLYVCADVKITNCSLDKT